MNRFLIFVFSFVSALNFCYAQKDYFEYKLNEDGKSLAVYGRYRKSEYKAGESVFPLYLEIPDSALYNGVYLPITAIGDSAFKSYEGEGVLIKEGPNQGLYHRTFTRFYEIKSVKIPNSINVIGDGAFCGCRNLTSVEIPNSVTKIGDDAFSYCKSLTSIEIPNSVTEIGDYAFYECDSLTSVEVPYSVKKLSGYAFKYCKLSVLTIYNSSALIMSGLASIDTLKLVNGLPQRPKVWKYGSKWYDVNVVVLPEDITEIPDSLFMGCDFKTIEIPENVTRIGKSAFSNNGSLSNVKFNNNLKVIDDSAFFGSSEKIMSLKLPDGLTKIGDYAFYKSQITSIEIPNSVRYLSGFGFCKGLTSVLIPDSVVTIGFAAFSGTNIESCNIPRSVKKIGKYAFQGTYISSIEIPNSVIEISDCAFRDSKLRKVKIPDSIKVINYAVFENCVDLVSVEIPKGVEEILLYAFYGCNNLSSIEIPKSVNYIETSAFNGCVNLKTVINHSDLNIVKGSETHGMVAYYADEVIGLENIFASDYEGTYTIYNVQGIKVLETKDKEQIQNLPKGVYVVKTDLGTEKQRLSRV